MAKFGALNNSTVGQHTKDDFRKVIEAQGFLCFWCAIPICEKSADPNCEATKEHLVPKSRGGVDFIWNIVAGCFACNRLRGNKLPGEFMRERWSLAQLVDDQAQKATRIPFTKGRFSPSSQPEMDDDGNLVTSHLEVAPVVGSMVRALARATRMEQSDGERRRQMLRDQVNTLVRLRLESAGQLTLQFDKPKPVVNALLETEAESLVVARGLHIANALRRQA